MIKGELQTEDGFLIVSIKQEPLHYTDVKTEPEEDDTYNSCTSHQQNVKTEIETDEKSEEAPEVHLKDHNIPTTRENNFKCDIRDKKLAQSISEQYIMTRTMTQKGHHYIHFEMLSRGSIRT